MLVGSCLFRPEPVSQRVAAPPSLVCQSCDHPWARPGPTTQPHDSINHLGGNVLAVASSEKGEDVGGVLEGSERDRLGIGERSEIVLRRFVGSEDEGRARHLGMNPVDLIGAEPHSVDKHQRAFRPEVRGQSHVVGDKAAVRNPI